MGFETHLRKIYPKLGREIPAEWYKIPVYYKGNPGSLGTHGDDIPIPSYGTALDIEFELAMVIGRGGMNIPADRALDHIFGYMIYNDFSERVIQAREMSVGLGPAKGKDFLRGHVMGPYLVTADEVPGYLQPPHGRSRQRRRLVREQLRNHPLEVRADDRPRLDRRAAARRRDPRLRNGRRRIGRRARHVSRPRRRRRARSRTPWHVEESSYLNADRHDQSRNRGNAATFDPLTDTELDDKIAHAAKTFQTYRRTPLAERAAWLLRAAEILEAEQGALGRLMTTEMGKLVKAGGEEAAKCAWGCRFYAEQAPRMLADTRRRARRRRASSAISRSVPSSR